MSLRGFKKTSKIEPKVVPERSRRPSEKRFVNEKLILSFWVAKKLQNGAQKPQKNRKKHILEPFKNTPKNMISQELFFLVFGATQEVPDPENQAKTL